MEEDTYLPDTSCVVEELLSKMIEEKEIKGRVIIHRAVIAELEHQANQGRPTGFLGLEELKKLYEIGKSGKIKVEYDGSRPTPAQIKYARNGEIDALIRDFAWDNGFILITCDRVQAEAGFASGMQIKFIAPKEKYGKKIKLESFFTPDTMSVHLREGVKPLAKIGKPGSWVFKTIKDKTMTEEDVKDVALEIIEVTKLVTNAFIEVDRKGSTIVQFGDYRIVICRPPFSDNWEITAVKPIAKPSLSHYKLNSKLIKRLDTQAEGILISGSPGMGKTTFAQALAEYYAKKGKLVKTVEAPRDLQVSKEISQYSKNIGSSTEIRDILLLTRPDYTIFDEMRDTEDFKLYADMRLSGVGMVGICHATGAIDAIQRFLGRLDLGIIPSVIDTVLFIKNGQVNKVLELKMLVKVPSGMTEKDLARPVIEIKDYLTGNVEYEIYVFGEETIVIPVKTRSHVDIKSKLGDVAKYADVEISDGTVYLYVEKSKIAKIIGKSGKRIKQLERRVGMPIEVEVR